MDRVCAYHPAMEARLRRIEVIQYVILGVGLGTGLLSMGMI